MSDKNDPEVFILTMLLAKALWSEDFKGIEELLTDNVMIKDFVTDNHIHGIHDSIKFLKHINTVINENRSYYTVRIAFVTKEKTINQITLIVTLIDLVLTF